MTASRRRSLVEERESTLEGRLSMAAARSAVAAVALINRAVDVSGLTQDALSRDLGVTPGRVSQVVNGDGNLRVSTLARFLRAAGYRLRFVAEPADAGIDPLPEPARSRRPAGERTFRYVAVRTVTTLTDEGVGPERVLQVSVSHPKTILEHGGTYELIVDVQTGHIEPGQVAFARTPQHPRSRAMTFEVEAAHV